MVILERFFNRLTDAQIEIGWDIEVTNGTICLLQFFYPDI